MRKKLIIIGARAFGRETCNYARDAGFDVVGFLDDKADALWGFTGYPPVICPTEEYQVRQEDRFVCAVGDSRMREKYVGIMAEKCGVFVNVIHPTAYVGPNVLMGVGCIVCPQALVDCDLRIGDHVDVNAQSYVSHDCVLEDFSSVSPGCKLGGGTILRHGAFLGIGVTTLPRIEIDEYAYIGAGAVVTKNIPSSVLAVGVPSCVKRDL